MTPKQRNEAAAALAAAMVAASAGPAVAEARRKAFCILGLETRQSLCTVMTIFDRALQVPQFSVFGFGTGQSDAGSQPVDAFIHA